MKYAFIQTHRKQYPFTRLCEMLEVSSSGYHDWLGLIEKEKLAKRVRWSVDVDPVDLY